MDADRQKNVEYKVGGKNRWQDISDLIADFAEEKG